MVARFEGEFETDRGWEFGEEKAHDRSDWAVISRLQMMMHKSNNSTHC